MLQERRNLIDSTSTDPKFKTMDDVRADKEFLAGVDSAFATSGARTTIALYALGLPNAKVSYGWTSGAERRLATIRGELDCSSGSYDSLRAYFKSGDMRPLCVISTERIPQAPDVPTIYELGVTKESEKWLEWEINMEKLGRPIVAPPDVPKNRVEFLRATMDKIAADPDYLKAVKKAKRNLMYLSGAETEKLVKKIVNLSPPDVEELKYLLSKKLAK